MLGLRCARRGVVAAARCHRPATVVAPASSPPGVRRSEGVSSAPSRRTRHTCSIGVAGRAHVTPLAFDAVPHTTRRASSTCASAGTGANAGDPSAAAARVHERTSELDAWHRRHGRYPHFTPTLSLREFQLEYGGLEPGARATDDVVLVAGRVTAKRQGSKSTAFIDIEEGYYNEIDAVGAGGPRESSSDGDAEPAAASNTLERPRVQVLAIRGRYTGSPVCGAAEDAEGGVGEKEEEAMYTPRDEFAEITGLLRRGDIVGVRGFPGKSKLGELSIIPTELVLLAPCLPNLPLSAWQDDQMSVRDTELRYRQRHVDLLVNNATRRRFIVRSRVISSLRRFMEARGFLEVETPLLYASAGGALARPFVTTSWAWDTELSLRIAPELFLKRLVVGGLDRVFEIGKVFRNEGVTPRHNPEFTTCEFYQAYANLESLMSSTEDLLHHVCTAVLGTSRVPKPGCDEGTLLEFSPPYNRIHITSALEEILGEPLPDPNDPARLPELVELVDRHGLLEGLPAPQTASRLVDRLIGEFLEPQCVQPTFLYGHPVVMSPLAKTMPGDPSQSARFELFVAGTELCNAYAELNDPEEQRERFRAQQQDAVDGDAEAHAIDEDYCRALEEVLLFPVMKPATAVATPTPADADA